jgi:hypothetical protein
VRKIFFFRFSENHVTDPRIPSRHEGRIAIVTMREAGCGGRARIM